MKTETKNIISACGIICNECPFFEKECKGCFSSTGKVFWTKDHTEKGICPLFDCSVNTKQYHHCGDCSELPCEMFRTMKDPSSTDEEHAEGLKKRVAVLRQD